ncbi:MAG: apolipoprotein N-acyltransferase [Aestuariibacter sp.]
MSKYLPCFIALLCGAILTLSFAPFSHWWITPLSLTCLFFIYLQKQPNGFWYGLSFGLGWFGAGISWVHVSIADFGGLPLAGSLALMLLLSAYLALFPALFFILLSKYQRRFPLLLTAMPLWWILEWLRSWFLTGFPWLSLGYSQIGGPFSGFAPIIGESGISVLLVISSLWLAQHLCHKHKPENLTASIAKTVIPTVFLFCLGYLLTFVDWVSKDNNAPTITMVQGNIKQELRWIPEQDKPTMEKYLQLTEPHWDSDFIIWPEAAIPKLEPLAQDYLYRLDKRARAANTALVTGIVNYNFETAQAFNNLIVVGNEQQREESDKATEASEGYRYLHANRYAKHHLLPIGEFIPLESWLRGLAPIFDLPMSSFSRGDYRQTNLNVNGWQLAPAICFEIAFPRQIRANIHSTTDFIITVSNDAWFGRSHGPAQHLEIAQMRALEMGLPIIRATNNGITAFINHRGAIVKAAPQFEDAVIRHSLTTTSGMTPYRYWGDALLWLFTAICVSLALWQARNYRKEIVAE